MEFYNISEIINIDIDIPCIYFDPKYCIACEYSDNYKIEYCIYKDLIFVYHKKEYIQDNKIYYDLLTPYGYSGFYFNDDNTFNEFIILFKQECLNRNYINYIIRQNPFININHNLLINNFNIINKKILFGIQLDDTDNYFDNYFYGFLKSKKRNMYNKALKLNYNFDYIHIKDANLDNNSEFRNMYNKTMHKVNSTSYYYFNDDYYLSLKNIDNSFLTYVKDESNNIIGFTIIFVENKYVHYHLSCNNESNNCIVDFLLFEIIKTFCRNRVFILGCGVNENDKLYNFKKSFSNIEYIYNIYKNI